VIIKYAQEGVINLAMYNLNAEVKEDEMVRAISTNGGEEGCM
jgi:hypothetical protein